MNLKLLGTGAADGIPAYCSNSEASKWAREHGGKDVRTRAAALLDDEIKLDFGPDTLTQIREQNVDCSLWSAVVFTHSDEDHLAVSELQYFLYPFCDSEALPFSIYGNRKVLHKVEERYPGWPMDLVETHSFEPVQIGAYKFTPIRAMHGCDEEAHNLLFERDGKKLLYATDTGIWPDATFEFLQNANLDLLVIECTDGLGHCDYDGHLDLEQLVSLVQRASKVGGLASEARIVTTHHKHTGGRHCDLVKACAKFGIEVGFDGMALEI